MRDETTSGPLESLLLELAAERSLDGLLQLIVTEVAALPTVALCRVWLIKEGDICDDCALRSECPTRTPCLHLVASAGSSVLDDAVSWNRLDGRFRRFPLGIRKVGWVGSEARPLIIHDAREDGWILDREWARTEAIRGMIAQPLLFRGERLGVMAVFTRSEPESKDLIWYRMLADHAAAAIANANAFDEIARLKERLEIENAYLREEVRAEGAFGDILGSSEAIRATARQIEIVAETDATVLVTGESGTGKELVAREVHRRSRRRDGPMIKVNCAAIPQNLYESEFFGHVAGAFSGAVRDRAGRFEAADGGTLFLDEVGEIPLEMQSKLLRVLQEGTFDRLGEVTPRSVDVRIVAATNRDLRTAVEAGDFREDLYYRLDVFPIAVAPLRKRKEDIADLARYFAARSCAKMSRPPLLVTDDCIQTLRDYDWPGNIRELQNLIERAVITSPGPELKVELPKSDRPIPPDPASAPPPAILTETELRGLERDNIVRALDHAQGKVSGPEGAAALLGLKPSTLASRMKSLDIRRTAR